MDNQLNKIVEAVAYSVKADLQKIEEAQKKENVKLAEEILNRTEGTSTELKRLQASFDEKVKEAQDKAEKAVKELTERFGNEIASIKKEASRVDLPTDLMQELKSPGQIFGESKELADYINGGCNGKSGLVEVNLNQKTNHLRTLAIKALTGTDVLRDFMATDRMTEIFRDPVRQGRVKSLFNVFPTTSNVIEYMQETSFTNNAATVAEGALKPESHITYDDASMTIRTIATWMPVNNQVLSDLPMLQAYIENRLIEGLRLVEDNQILYGDGNAPNLQGIMTHADVPTYNWSQGVLGDSKIDAIRRAITVARLQEYPVTAVILNPSDWEDIELQKDDESRYIWGAAPGLRVDPTVWRLPVIDTTAITAGDFLTGAFGAAAAIFDREQAGVRVTQSHADYFVYNKTVILVEERLCLVVFRPNAFVIGSFDNAPIS